MMVVQALLIATYASLHAGHIVEVKPKFCLDVECDRNRGSRITPIFME